ncbi:MAG: hypothetical protein AB7F86_15345 [Bdellovibrionales bacterium]
MKWQLDRLKFLRSSVEGIVDPDLRVIRDRALEFSAETGLEKIDHLLESSEDEKSQSLRLLDRLVTYYDAGILVRRNQASSPWRVTDLFWRGSVFHLQESDQVEAKTLDLEAGPGKVRRAQGERILQALGMEFLCQESDAHGYFFRPTETVGFLLFSRLPEPWAVDHVAQTQRLVNKAFLF